MYSYSEEYKLQNDIAKKELIKVLKKKKLSKDKYSRCCKELDILYEESTLFIIYLLFSMGIFLSFFIVTLEPTSKRIFRVLMLKLKVFLFTCLTILLIFKKSKSNCSLLCI